MNFCLFLHHIAVSRSGALISRPSVSMYGTLVVLLGLSVLLSGCGLIFDYDNCKDDAELTGLTIHADWKYAETADPEGMAYLFFPDDGGRCWRFDFPGRDAGHIELPLGGDAMVCFNDDTSDILLSDDEQFEKITASTSASGLYAGNGNKPGNDYKGPTEWNGEPVRVWPDKMWAAKISRLHLTDDKVTWTEETGGEWNESSIRELVVFPRQITPRVRVEVDSILNLESVKAVNAWISGMSASFRFSDMSCDGKAVTHPFSLGRSDSGRLRGSLMIFGRVAGNILTLRFVMSNGETIEKSYDVTDQLTQSPDQMDMLVRICGIELPDTGAGSSGGLEVSVDGWTVIEIELDDNNLPF